MARNTGSSTWRDFQTDGDSGSGTHQPIKSEVRTWAAARESGWVKLDEFGTAPTVASLKLFFEFLDTNPEWLGVITGQHSLSGWTGHQITAALNLHMTAGASLTFTSPVAADLFTTDTAFADINFSDCNWTGPTGSTRMNFLNLGSHTGTANTVIIDGGTITGFEKLAELDTPGTIKKLRLSNLVTDGCENGFFFDCLLHHVVVDDLKMINLSNPIDEITKGLRLGKDAAAGNTNQSNSAQMFLRCVNIQQVVNTHATGALAQINGIELYGEDITCESCIVEGLDTNRASGGDMEEFYSKIRRGRFRGCTAVGGPTAGQTGDQGMFTIKGEHPDLGSNASPIGQYVELVDCIADGNSTAVNGFYISAADVSVKGCEARDLSRKALWAQENPLGTKRFAIDGFIGERCEIGIVYEGPLGNFTARNIDFYDLARSSGDCAGITIDFSSASAFTGGECVIENVMIDGVTTQASDDSYGIFVSANTLATKNADRLVMRNITTRNLTTSNVKLPFRIWAPAGAAEDTGIAFQSVLIDGWDSDIVFGEINTGSSLLKNFRASDVHVEWSESTASTDRQMMTWYMADNTIQRGEAVIRMREAGADVELFDLSGVRSKVDGLLTTLGTDTDAEAVTGKTWNAKLATVVDATNTDIKISATDFSFAATNKINKAAGDLTVYEAGEKIQVTSTSTTNNGAYTISSVTTLQIVTVETTITTENAATAGTVTINKRQDALSLQANIGTETTPVVVSADLEVWA